MILSEQYFIEKISLKLWRQGLSQGIARLHQKITDWQLRQRERVLIAQMSERDFKDFGMTREQMLFQFESRSPRNVN